MRRDPINALKTSSFQRLLDPRSKKFATAEAAVSAIASSSSDR